MLRARNQEELDTMFTAHKVITTGTHHATTPSPSDPAVGGLLQGITDWAIADD